MQRRDELLEKFGGETPRYTSYPPANRFDDSVDSEVFRGELAGLDPRRQLGLYVHVPFCERRCSYCGCFVVPTRNERVREQYVEALGAESRLLGSAVGTGRRCDFISIGGGTPSSLSPEQFRRLVGYLRDAFDLSDLQEFSVEIDPRVTTPDHVDTLVACGVDRVSLGVQDKSDEVQRAIGRDQRWDETLATYERFRRAGISSINVDLVYGLPEQTMERFAATLDGVVAMEPERICIFGYAHLPEKLRNQRVIDATTLPAPRERWDLLIEAHRVLEACGYVHVGLDHFVRPDDALAEAQRFRTLGRGFMGYTQFRAAALIGLGASAISEVPRAYAQNVKKLADYFRALEKEELPVERGLQLGDEDVARRFVIHEILCNLSVDFDEFEGRYGEPFVKMFADELCALATLAHEGLVEVFDDEIRVTAEGRWFLRTIAAVFDPVFANRQRVAGLRGLHSASI